MERTQAADTQETVGQRDQRLLRAWQNGDTGSGGELVRAYQPLFFQLSAQRGIRATDELLDLQGEMMVELCKNLDRLWIRTGFATCVHWAWKSAFKRFLTLRRGGTTSIDLESYEDAKNPGPEASAERDEFVEAIISCAAALDIVEYAGSG